mmetsp:Transcript_13298/g.35655  ORF Transcript_13298/g.35655 Transcript_13298/m.35655 type:complete len:221 (-) Transcript_13298:20-682(-)
MLWSSVEARMHCLSLEKLTLPTGCNSSSTTSCPFRTSYRLKPPSVLPATISSPATVTHRTESVASARTWMAPRPRARRSQTRTDLSCEALKTRSSRGPKASEFTLRSWPVNFRITLPLVTSHWKKSRSPPQDRNFELSSVGITSLTSWLWGPVYAFICNPVCGFQSRTDLSCDALNMKRPFFVNVTERTADACPLSECFSVHEAWGPAAGGDIHRHPRGG